MLILYPIIIPIIMCLILGIIAYIYKKIRNKIYLKETYNDSDFLNREISTQIPPSIVGYLFCQKPVRLQYRAKQYLILAAKLSFS